MSMIDNLLAFRILYMLVTPFEKTDAYKFGIIDKDGNPLKKTKDLKTTEEKNSYTNLNRLVFSLKRLLGKLPGGKSQLASIVAAYWLIKESSDKRTVIREEELLTLIDLIEEKKLVLFLHKKRIAFLCKLEFYIPIKKCFKPSYLAVKILLYNCYSKIQIT